MGQSDGLGWGTWLLILVAVLILIGAITLAVFGSSVRPAQHEVEQVLSNDRFPS
jgi:Sec-independent protein translocase protein TatA